MNKWTYVIVVNDKRQKECQTVHTQKEDNYHKIATTHHYNTSSQQSAEDRTLGQQQ